MRDVYAKEPTGNYFEDENGNLFSKLNDGTYRVIVSKTLPKFSEHIFDVRDLIQVMYK